MPEDLKPRGQTRPSAEPWLRHAERLVFVLLFGWLAAAAWLVRVEIFDGYHNLCNARYFLGLTDDYQTIRFPMMALLMLPAEAIKELLGLHPLDVRLHHISMALLNSVYLIAVYSGLLAICGRTAATLLAFVGVVLNLAFFAMAPFISSDILPGAVLLWMVILLDRFLTEPRTPEWIGLVVLGFFAASIKHVFGIFWVAILIAAAASLLAARVPLRRSMQLFGVLALGAALSGSATWLLEGYALAGELGGEPIWKRTWLLLAWFGDVAAAGQDAEMLAPAWLYLRNLWAYGWLIVTGALAGMVLAPRSGASRVERIAVIAMVVVVGIMQILPVKNVRFLSAVLPVAAIPAIMWFRVALKRRYGIALVVALLAIDVYHALPLAIRIVDPFFRDNSLRAFLEPVDRAASPPRVLWVGDYLSFTPGRPSLLVGDLYHDMYHFGPRQMRVLYDLRPTQLIVLPHFRMAGYLSEYAAAGDLLVQVSHRLINSESWDPTPPHGREQFAQAISVVDRSVEKKDERVTLQVLNRCRYMGTPLAFSCESVHPSSPSAGHGSAATGDKVK